MPFRNLPGVTQCRFKRGDYLIRAGESVDYVYYLLQGTVYRELISPSGRISILSSRAKGSITQAVVGLLVIYRDTENVEKAPVSRYDFIAHTNCLAYRIPRLVLLDFMRQNPKLLEEIVILAVEEYTKLMVLFQAKTEGNVAGRLCGLLLERARETEKGLLVSRKITNVEMAKFLSVHKVTVARILRALKEEQMIMRTADGLLLLEPEKLRQYAENQIELKYK